MHYIAKINWAWGNGHTFGEVKEYRIRDRAELPDVVRQFAAEMTRRYAFDCGRLDKPLHPYISSIELVPVQESEYLYLDDIGLEGLVDREVAWTRHLIETGQQYVNGRDNTQPAPEDFGASA